MVEELHWLPLTLAAEDRAWMQMQERQAQELCRVFGISQQELGIVVESYSLEEKERRTQAFVQHLSAACLRSAKQWEKIEGDQLYARWKERKRWKRKKKRR